MGRMTTLAVLLLVLFIVGCNVDGDTSTPTPPPTLSIVATQTPQPVMATPTYTPSEVWTTGEIYVPQASGYNPTTQTDIEGFAIPQFYTYTLEATDGTLTVYWGKTE